MGVATEALKCVAASCRGVRIVPVIALVTALAASGCLSEGRDGAVLSSSAETPLPSIHQLEGTVDFGAGAPTTPFTPFASASQGKLAGEFPVHGVSNIRVEASWSSLAPTYYEIHVQSPSQRVWSAASLSSSSATLEIDGAEEAGDWIFFLTPVGPAGPTTWKAAVTVAVIT